MSRLPLRDLAGTCLAVRVSPRLPSGADRVRLVRELARELACFPAWRGPPRAGIAVELRGPRAPGEAGPGTGILVARVTPEVTVELDPRSRRAVLFLRGRPRIQEVVLAAWAQAATLARLVGSPRGRRRTTFHAASLAGRGGGVLVLGESGAGKTTLSLLLSQGLVPGLAPCEYLGDEDALVELGPGVVRLLPLPRRIRALGGSVRAYRLRGTRGRAFGESALVLDRPAPGLAPRPAPLRAIVELVPRREPAREAGGPVRLEPLVGDRLAFALLAGLERFPTEAVPDPEVRTLFQVANRDGFAVALDLARKVPGFRLAYDQPEGFAAAARALAGLLEPGPGSPRLKGLRTRAPTRRG